MSRFEATSDIGRFHALPQGGSIEVERRRPRCSPPRPSCTRKARRLRRRARLGRRRVAHRRRDADRLDAGVRLDLGGIAKGYAVDRGVAALLARGCRAGYVNAGGDLRVFGALELPVVLRDEQRGGVRPFCTLSDGALATSHFAASSRSTLFATRRAGGADSAERHVSVAAPTCLMADALTKVVAAAGRTDHPLLARHGAIAWRH